MNTIRNTGLLSLLLGTLFFLSACDSAIESTTELTAAEATLVSEIAAQTLSDAQDGTMSDLNDLNASVGAEGLGYGEGPLARHQGMGGPANRLWRGPNTRHHAAYDSSTGEHTIQYQRAIQTNFMSKGLNVKLVYVFTDAAGDFIARPGQQRDAIAAITFTGERSGFTRAERPNGAAHHSRFGRTAAWQVAGVQAGTVSFEGAQDDRGIFTRTNAEGDTMERYYEASLRTRNVTLTKADAGAGIEGAVSGQLLYTLLLKHTADGDTTEKRVEGTIELEGNGKALLRILGTNHLYRIDLKDGNVDREG